MKVKELISLLSQCDSEANVYVESYSDMCANVVRQYSKGNNTVVYIADTTDYIDDDMEEVYSI